MTQTRVPSSANFNQLIVLSTVLSLRSGRKLALSNRGRWHIMGTIVAAHFASTLPPIGELTASKQSQLFESLKRQSFSGQLRLASPHGQSWILHFQLGRIVYANGGVHPVRRWRRMLATTCPRMLSEASSWQQSLDGGMDSFPICWQYQLLCAWVAAEKISREQANQAIRFAIAEVLFDIAQIARVTYRLQPDTLPSETLALVDTEQATEETQRSWRVWQQAGIAEWSLNSAPLLRQPDRLRVRTSEQAYRALVKLLNGQQTVRDLAIKMRRNAIDIVRSLMPYIQQGWVEFASIPDLPPPLSPLPPKPQARPASQGPLIACIDDSPAVCRTLGKVVTAAGYQFVGINDPLRAIAVLLARKPDLIFLDLVMPNANGYEICSRLRKIARFQDTPIIILTGDDGIVDRVRARMVGSSDFLGKPVKVEKLLDVMRKHLQQPAATA